MLEQYYDLEQARNTLEQLASEKDNVEDRRLAKVMEMADWTNSVQIACSDTPQTWRLLQKETGRDEGAMEEMIFTVRGVVCSIDLPPVLEKPSLVSARYKFLRQGITVTGLGSSTFEAAAKSAKEIYNRFHREFADGKLEDWCTATGLGYEALSASNRYFTPKRDAPDMAHIRFSEWVDPHGILESMTRGGYVHGEENVVHYYVCYIDERGIKRYNHTKPQSFRIGDIVEIQLSFVVVPLKGQRYKMLTVLRSIALLESRFSQEAMTKRMSNTTVVRPKTTIRRRVGYNNDSRDLMDIGY